MDIDVSVLKAVMTGAVSGGGTVALVVRAWLKRIEKGMDVVGDNTRRITALEIEFSHLGEHQGTMTASIQRIETGLATLVGDVSYLRGRSDEKFGNK